MAEKVIDHYEKLKLNAAKKELDECIELVKGMKKHSKFNRLTLEQQANNTTIEEVLTMLQTRRASKPAS